MFRREKIVKVAAFPRDGEMVLSRVGDSSPWQDAVVDLTYIRRLYGRRWKLDKAEVNRQAVGYPSWSLHQIRTAAEEGFRPSRWRLF